MAFEIRRGRARARRADPAALRVAVRAARLAPPAWDPQRARRGAARRRSIRIDSAVLVAEDGGELVGLCTAYLELELGALRAAAAGSRTSPSTPSAARAGIGGRCSTRPATGRASVARPTSSSTPRSTRADAQRFYERRDPDGRLQLLVDRLSEAGSAVHVPRLPSARRRYSATLAPRQDLGRVDRPRSHGRSHRPDTDKTDEQKAITEMVRQFVDKEILPSPRSSTTRTSSPRRSSSR